MASALRETQLNRQIFLFALRKHVDSCNIELRSTREFAEKPTDSHDVAHADLESGQSYFANVSFLELATDELKREFYEQKFFEFSVEIERKVSE